MKLVLTYFYLFFKLLIYYNFTYLNSQTHIPADPNFLLQYEKAQFQNSLPLQPNIFRPTYFNSDSLAFSITLKSEGYFNDNAPNQENMDVRYFSKGFGRFQSVQFSFNSPFFTFMAEPYLLNYTKNKFNKIDRPEFFKNLNDNQILNVQNNNNLRNLLIFVNYKGLGFGWQSGNRWWGPGIHTSLQMTNNTSPIPTQIIGTIKEIKIGSFGFYTMYSFSNINKGSGELPKFHTALNGQLTWYGPVIVALGFSRNYLSGGLIPATGRIWSNKDARALVFEGIFTSNLLDNEYTVGGHDSWDQTLSGYLSLILPKRNIKFYIEAGVNDNRMYFADFLSQPDHTLATIIGMRDYGVGNNKNWLYGFEWSNIMLTYTIRHRGAGGTPAWYSRGLYDYSSFNSRRWAAHSGADSDDWYFYVGYLSDKLMFVPAINYERHGIVSQRPAEVKIEFRLDTRYKYNNYWLGIYFEKQFEAFLGFPDYFYVDDIGSPIDSEKGSLANTRNSNTIILSITRTFNF